MQHTTSSIVLQNLFKNILFIHFQRQDASTTEEVLFLKMHSQHMMLVSWVSELTKLPSWTSTMSIFLGKINNRRHVIFQQPPIKEFPKDSPPLCNSQEEWKICLQEFSADFTEHNLSQLLWLYWSCTKSEW